ncbi:hypothetical protein CCP3SC1AL1_3830005 [Gammaproteobacteria bacterium]
MQIKGVQTQINKDRVELKLAEWELDSAGGGGRGGVGVSPWDTPLYSIRAYVVKLFL